MKYDVNYFITKFKAIPSNMWLIRSFREDGGKACVMGHCDYRSGEKDCLKELFLNNIYLFSPLVRCNAYHEQQINNGDDPKYQQLTPKERILAALYDIKRAQEPEIKEIIRYVAVDSPIREEAKELLTEKTN